MKRERKETVVIGCRIEKRVFANILYYYRVVKNRKDLTKAKIIKNVFASFENAIREEIPFLEEAIVNEVLAMDEVEVVSIKIPDPSLDLDEAKERYLEALAEGLGKEGEEKDEDGTSESWRNIL